MMGLRGHCVTTVVMWAVSMLTSTVTSQNACDVINNGWTEGEQAAGFVQQVVEKHEAILLLVLGFGGFSVIVAITYNSIRRYVFRDVSNFDTTFDAGGRVTMSLTMVTVGMQLLWPADMLQSATVTTKMGIAGAFWYSTAVVTNIILFPLLSVKFKTRAPGAKTFLQVVRARFGKGTHIVFCCFALLTNVVILTVIIISCTDLFQSLVKDASDEFCVLVMATLFGSYSCVGGLGSTFYVSYFNALVVFIILATFVIRVFYLPGGDGELRFGDLDQVYSRVQCLLGPVDNKERSYATFWSADSLVWMVQGVFIAASVTFCDQASWQSRIAAKPVQGVLGFFGATLLWFAVPTTIGTTTAITYLSFSAGNKTLMLSDADIDAGLVVPYIAQQAMGRDGAFMVLIMLTMLMMATGSGEVMGISSIIVYDFYQSYIRPFRPGLEVGHCILCGKGKRDEAAEETTNSHLLHENDICCCVSVRECPQCTEDERARLITSRSGVTAISPRHQCVTHGRYRTYQDVLVQFTNWCILWVSIGIVPFGLVMLTTGINLNWVFLAGCVVTIPCFPGVVLCIVWVKTTAKGMVTGSITGLICGIIVLLARASSLPGGLNDFLLNTSEGYTVMAGSCTSFFVTLLVTVIVSLITHNIKDSDDEKLEWQKMRDIDNPLNPWVGFYREEFPSLKGDEKPSYEALEAVFRKAKVTAVVGSTCGLVLFIFVIPGVMAAMHVLSRSEFGAWVTTMHAWCFFMAVVVIVVTPVEEVITIWKELKSRKEKKSLELVVSARNGPEGTNNPQCPVEI